MFHPKDDPNGRWLMGTISSVRIRTEQYENSDCSNGGAGCRRHSFDRRHKRRQDTKAQDEDPGHSHPRPVHPSRSQGEEYYMYGRRHGAPARRLATYVSSDLKEWEGRLTSSCPTRGSGATEFGRQARSPGALSLRDLRRGKVLRATQILVSDSPRGPFASHRPADHPFAGVPDGTLFVDDERRPGSCSAANGSRSATARSRHAATKDLYPAATRSCSSVPPRHPGSLRFRGRRKKKAGTTSPTAPAQDQDGQTADAWSSFDKKNYVQALAISESGKITGPWKRTEAGKHSKDGGTGCCSRPSTAG